MDTARDLSRVEPWQESLERSRARRRRAAARPSSPPRRRSSKRAHIIPLSAAIGLIALAVAVPGMFGGRAAQADQSFTFGIPARTPHADLGATGAAAPSVTDVCRPTVRPIGYSNPLRSARVTPERIDQGVDYAGSGWLTAIGAGTITNVSSQGSGWPGAFIEYQLMGGVDAGCYVYYAEGISPVAGLRVGQTIRAGQPLATIIPHWPTGIEVGWGAGTQARTYASLLGQWSASSDDQNDPTPAGRSFSALIASLGGPPGKLEGSGQPGPH